MAKVLPTNPARGRVYESVDAERGQQDAKWGVTNHDPFTALTILMEEVGEAAQAALHLRFGGFAAESLREELVQVAAVAVEMIETLDRKEWSWVK